jgi:hypothetical protein
VLLLLGRAILLVFAMKVKRDMKRSKPRVDALADRQKWIALAGKLLTLCIEIQKTSNVPVTEKGFADPQILALALLSRTYLNLKRCDCSRKKGSGRRSSYADALLF